MKKILTITLTAIMAATMMGCAANNERRNDSNVFYGTNEKLTQYVRENPGESVLWEENGIIYTVHAVKGGMIIYGFYDLVR